MAYVTQDKFNEAIDHLGRHIDRRLTTLETEVKTLRTDMVQGFEKVDQRFVGIDERFDGIDRRFDRLEESLAASNKLHNDNHLELKQMFGVLLQEIRNK
jgi:hypothetical protein